ncbi:MAG: chorismate mutase [Lachnospiraceae bacterium]|nr:chorismate mutase [Lachnospiraceae bacterium]
MKDLGEIRQEIDKIDREIVDLYEKRMDLSTQVADYKISTGMQVFDPQREIAKLNAVAEMAHTDFTSHGARELFEHIMCMSREKQYQLLTQHGMSTETGFEETDSLDFTNATAAYVSSSEVAAGSYFPDACRLLLCENWISACETLKLEEVDYLFLPVQDPESGYVSANYNLVAEYGFYILEEYHTSPEPQDRYLLISRDRIALNGADKITMCFEAPDVCGSLYHLMSHLTYNNLNMNRIESIVINRDPLDYRFFMDVSGNLKDAPIKNALLGFSEEARNFKILGNYR